MKGAKRTWIIGLILLVLSVYLVSAQVSGLGKLRDVWDSVGNTIEGKIKSENFVYMFIAIGLVTFFFLNKNEFTSKMSVWVSGIISVVLAFIIAEWRMEGHGGWTYVIIISACWTIMLLKSSGEHNKASGIYAGLMYMVAAGVMAPFASIVTGASLVRAFFTHFLIGVLFPTIGWEIWSVYSKKMEEGKKLAEEAKEKEKENKKIEQEEKDRLKREDKGIEEQKERDEEYAKRMEELKKREEALAKNPFDNNLRMQYVQQAMPAFTGVPAAMIIHVATGEPKDDTKKIKEEIDAIKTAIKKLKEDFANTTKGKAASWVYYVMSNIEKRGNSFMKEMFGENWNDDSKFFSEFARVSGKYGSHAVFRGMKKRMERCRKDVGGVKGFIDPNDFVNKFAKPLIRDYKRDTERDIKILEKSLHEKIHKGNGVIRGANDFRADLDGLNKGIEEDERKAEDLNKGLFALRKNIQRLSEPRLSAAEINEILRQNVEYYFAIIQRLNEKVRNEKEMSERMKLVRKGLDNYLEEKEEYRQTETVDVLQAEADALGEEAVGMGITEQIEEQEKKFPVTAEDVAIRERELSKRKEEASMKVNA